MSATFVLKRSDGSEDSITVVYNETPETFAGKVGSFDDVISIDIEFDNTGRRIPVFIYSEEELEQLNNATEDSPPARPSFLATRKYFSPSLKSELEKFNSLTEINIIASGVIEDDSFPSSFPVNIKNEVFGKILPRVDPPLNLSTPDDLYNLMISTDALVLDGNYVLMNDIDMTGYNSQSIGDYNIYNGFTGSFDGQGYTIKIAQTVLSNFGGLFNFINNSAFIKDLTVEYLADSSGNCISTFTGCPLIGTFTNGGLAAYMYRDSELIEITNCNVIYNGNVSMSGSVNSGFAGSVNVFAGLPINMTNCNVVFEGDATMTFIFASRGGSFSGFFNNCTVVGCSSTINGNLSMTNNGQAGGFCGGILSANVSGCSLTGKNINISNNTTPATPSGGFIGFVNGGTLSNNSMKIRALTIENVSSGSAGIASFGTTSSSCSDFNALIEGDVNITCQAIGDAGGIVGQISAPNTAVSRLFGVFAGNVTLSALSIGGLIGSILPSSGTSSISNSNVSYNKIATFTAIGPDPQVGGVCGVCGVSALRTGSVNNCSVFYGTNAIFSPNKIGGVGSTCISGSSFTKVTATYNNYTFTGTTVDDTFSFAGGTVTDCFSNTFSSDTSVIPDTNTTNIITQLESIADTEWLSSLLNIRQSLDVANNSQYLSDIFTDSAAVSNTAKNNALTAGMTFATVPYIITTSSVIEPLLVKYQSPLPTTIRYAAQNSVDEIDISELAAYYIYQNPAYIVPANKTIESSTDGVGSVVFDTTSVDVGSKITINNADYNVRGVGSSLLEVTAAEPLAEGSNNLPIFFAVIAGVILLLVLVFSYIWGWKGWMVLPAIIGLTLAILAIVFAL